MDFLNEKKYCKIAIIYRTSGLRFLGRCDEVHCCSFCSCRCLSACMSSPKHCHMLMSKKEASLYLFKKSVSPPKFYKRGTFRRIPSEFG